MVPKTFSNVETGLNITAGCVNCQLQSVSIVKSHYHSRSGNRRIQLTIHQKHGHVNLSCILASKQDTIVQYVISSPGDIDPYVRVGADAGVVPADSGKTEGAGHHCAGIQQHGRHAGRDLSCLQDRVLRHTWDCINCILQVNMS